MAGIYIHIPFCRKACHYCNFHFSTSLQHQAAFVAALEEEISQWPLHPFYSDILCEPINTIYFGGGTPSLLLQTELERILLQLHLQFTISESAEITLEANPDDMSETKLLQWHNLGINRLSIGVQSFIENELVWMNRAHSADQAFLAINNAKKVGFKNMSIDLIYGTPTLSTSDWLKNLQYVEALAIPHLSCYALTVEEKTALHYFIKKGKVPPVDEEKQILHLDILMNWAAKEGWNHYEISNLCKPTFQSQHNSAYWKGIPYIGFGPGAHSFNGKMHRWSNIANNGLYINNIKKIHTLQNVEEITPIQRLNEQIMTQLRLEKGLAMVEATQSIGGIPVDAQIWQVFWQTASKFEQQALLSFHSEHWCLTKQGVHLADHIIAELFQSE